MIVTLSISIVFGNTTEAISLGKWSRIRKKIGGQARNGDSNYRPTMTCEIFSESYAELFMLTI